MQRKVEELCRIELSENRNMSASQLCKLVAKKIESEYVKLLEDFTPYNIARQHEGNDWKQPAF